MNYANNPNVVGETSNHQYQKVMNMKKTLNIILQYLKIPTFYFSLMSTKCITDSQWSARKRTAVPSCHGDDHKHPSLQNYLHFWYIVVAVLVFLLYDLIDSLMCKLGWRCLAKARAVVALFACNALLKLFLTVWIPQELNLAAVASSDVAISEF